MPDSSIYVDPSVTTADVIRVGNTCYKRIGPSSHAAEVFTIAGESSSCTACNCCGGTDVTIAITLPASILTGPGHSGTLTGSAVQNIPSRDHQTIFVPTGEDDDEGNPIFIEVIYELDCIETGWHTNESVVNDSEVSIGPYYLENGPPTAVSISCDTGRPVGSVSFNAHTNDGGSTIVVTFTLS